MKLKNRTQSFWWVTEKIRSWQPVQPRITQAPAQPECCAEFIPALRRSQPDRAVCYQRHAGRPACLLTVSNVPAPRGAIYAAAALSPPSAAQHTVCNTPTAHGAAQVVFLSKTRSYRNAVFFQERDRTSVSTQSTLPRYTGRLFIAMSNLGVVFWFSFLFWVFFWWAAFYFCAVEIHVPPKPICNCPHST